MTAPANLLESLPRNLPDELFESIFQRDGLRIDRIVSTGQCSPEGFWYEQESHEWVLVLAGAARLKLEGEESIELRPGSHVNIPARKRHRVEWTDTEQTTVWLAVHYADLK